MIRNAIISDCQKYRYFLERLWDDNLPRVLFIMLNPSTADAKKDDATIRRCTRFAENWNYGGFYVINLFAFRSPKPIDLLKAIDPIGLENEIWFRRSSAMASLIVCAWGNSNTVSKLQKSFPNHKPLKWLDSMKPLNYIELSKDGTPKHPLYLLKSLTPKPYAMEKPKILEWEEFAQRLRDAGWPEDEIKKEIEKVKNCQNDENDSL